MGNSKPERMNGHGGGVGVGGIFYLSELVYFNHLSSSSGSNVVSKSEGTSALLGHLFF